MNFFQAIGAFWLAKAVLGCGCTEQAERASTPQQSKPAKRQGKRPVRYKRYLVQEKDVIRTIVAVKNIVIDGDGFESLTGPHHTTLNPGTYAQKHMTYLLLRHNGEDIRVEVDSDEEAKTQIEQFVQQIKQLKQDKDIT